MVSPVVPSSLRRAIERGDAALDLALAWLLTAPGWWPLLSGRHLGTHDGYYHLYRLFELDRAVRAGDLYPRWAPEFALGYGYPVFNYYPPLLLYLAELFALTGRSLIVSLNLAQLVCMLGAAASAYLLGRELFGRLPGVVVAVLYASLPYFLIDLYVRGAVAETLALALLPLVAWALRRVALAPSARRVAAAGLVVGLLALGHNITSLIALPVIGLDAAMVARWRPRRLACLLGAAMLGLALGAVYWLPALLERGLVSSEVLTTLFYDFHNHFQALVDVVQRTLAFEYRYDYFAGFLFRAGLVQVALGALGGVVALVRLAGLRREVGFWAVIALAALLLQSSRSAPIWESVPLLGYAQFPWRMLALVGIASALLCGAGIAALGARWRGPVAVLGVALWLWASFAGLRPALLELRPDEVSVGALNRIELERKLVGTTTAGEYTPRWESRGTFEGWREPLPGSPDVVATSLVSAGRHEVTLRVETPAGGRLVLDQYYFPGWQASVGGTAIPVAPVGDRGLLGVELPAGAREVTLRFGGTPLRTGAAAVSLAACLALAALALWSRRSLGGGDAAESQEAARAPRSGEREPSAVARASALAELALRSGRLFGGAAVGHSPAMHALRADARRDSAVTRFMALVAPVMLLTVAVWAALGASAEPAAAAIEGARGGFDFEGGPRLLGVAGELNELSLYWTTSAETSRSLDVALRLIDDEGRVLGRRDKAPRFGLRPTTIWRPGAVVRDLQSIELLQEIASGRRARLVVGLHDSAGYLEPRGGEVVRWRERCACAAPSADGIGVLVGRVEAERAPDRTVLPLRRGVERTAPVAAGRIQLLDWDYAALGVDTGPEPFWAPLAARIDRRTGGRLTRIARRLLPGSASGESVARVGGPGGVLATLAPGERLDVQLRWRALADVDEDYAVFVHLLDANQKLVAQDDEWPRRGFSPTSLWTSGQETLDHYEVKLPLDAAPGRYTLAVGLYRRAGLVRLPWSGDPAGRDQVVLGSVKIAPVAPDVAVAQPLGRRFGPAIELVGLEAPLPSRAAPGSTLLIHPRWRASAAPERDYTVFVHLVDAAGKVVANGDSPPLRGRFPTSVWEAGDVVPDAYQVTIPADARGPMRVLIGLYRPDTGERLPVDAGGDSLELARIEVP
jgi:hypothetical protein